MMTVPRVMVSAFAGFLLGLLVSNVYSWQQCTSHFLFLDSDQKPAAKIDGSITGPQLYDLEQFFKRLRDKHKVSITKQELDQEITGRLRDEASYENSPIGTSLQVFLRLAGGHCPNSEPCPGPEPCLTPPLPCPSPEPRLTPTPPTHCPTSATNQASLQNWVERFNTVLDPVKVVTENKAYIVPGQTQKGETTKGGNFIGGNLLPELWKYIIERYKITSVLDIACGLGESTAAFRSLGVPEVFGTDGLRENIIKSSNGIFLHDFLVGPLLLGRTVDFIWACEFLEHVDYDIIPFVMLTMMQAKVVGANAAGPGQTGHHHVILRTWEDFWLPLFKKYGFEEELDITNSILQDPHYITEKNRGHTWWGRAGHSPGRVLVNTHLVGCSSSVDCYNRMRSTE